MQATGIIRNVSKTGIIAIPKEIRIQMGIQNNEPLEIFIDRANGDIIFHKYLDTPLNKAIKAFENLNAVDQASFMAYLLTETK